MSLESGRPQSFAADRKKARGICARPLPDTDLVAPAGVDRQAFVRFDTNRYSVPTEYAERTLTLVAERRAAADLKGRDRLRAAAPEFGALLERWALAGPSLAIQVTRAIKVLYLYGDVPTSTPDASGRYPGPPGSTVSN
jgi:hypothetical protein